MFEYTDDEHLTFSRRYLESIDSLLYNNNNNIFVFNDGIDHYCGLPLLEILNEDLV